MNVRATGFLALSAVIGLSIAFGMVIGGKLNAPEMVLAAPDVKPLKLAPAATGGPGMMNFADIVEQAMPAVVSVTSMIGDEEREEGSRLFDQFRNFFGEPESEPERERRRSPHEPRIREGSGFIISSDGYLMTNNHVVEDADRIVVGMQNGDEYEARVIGTDPSIDLALLKIDPGDDELLSLSLGDSESIRVGEWVIAIGNPLEYEHTVTAGVVSAKQRRVPIGGTDTGVVSFIQTDAAINFGNSGGPLLDSRGNVIGINTAIRRANFAEGIGFALPINHARRVMEQLREKGYVSRGFIGITMNAGGIDEEAREFYGLPDTHGVIIQGVEPDGPADTAGLRKGDIVRSVDDETVRDNMDLITKISSHQPDDRVKLEVFRGGETIKMTATLGDRMEGLKAQAGGRRGRTPGRTEEPVPVKSTGLGITVENFSNSDRDNLYLEEDVEGVLITGVDYETEASDKGIRPGMVVVSVNDVPVRDVGDWDASLEGLRPGSPVKLDLMFGPRGRWIFLRVPEE